MDLHAPDLMGLIAALGSGLLLGIERERHKGRGSQRQPLGLRSFLLATLAGAVAARLGDAALAVTLLAAAAFALAGYLRVRDDDPGLTTELALLLAVLLGALAMHAPAAAAALAVLTTLALVAKTRLHRFARRVLSAGELHAGLLLATAVLVVLPLLPDRPLTLLAGLNLRTLWMLALLVMAIQSLGYVALRLLGPARGLALSGFVGGFVSSTATIGAMGQRVRQQPALFAACLGGALLSNIATVLQLALLVGALAPALLLDLTVPLLAAGVAALFAAAIALRRGSARVQRTAMPLRRRPFDPRHALGFALVVSAVLLGADAARRALGATGALLATTVAGLADAHAAAVSVAQLTVDGHLSSGLAVVAVLAAFSSNALSKCGAAWIAGGLRFAAPLAAAQAAIVGATWLAWWIARA